MNAIYTLTLLISFSILSTAVFSQGQAMSAEEYLSYCTANQNKRQCQKMAKYDTRAKIKANYEAKGDQYCDNEIFNQESCRNEFAKLIRTGCVSEPYVKNLLFAGSSEQYDRTPREKRTYQYFPMCSAGAIMTFCKCGCFDKSVNILAEAKIDSVRQWVPIQSLVENKDDYSLFSLSEELKPRTSPLIKKHDKFGVLKGEGMKKHMVTVKTKGQRTIRVTHDHPLLTNGNRIILAKDLEVGTKLYSTDGEEDPVADVQTSVEIVDIFNVETPAKYSDVSGHLIFANDLIVGDLALQQSFVSEDANKKAREQ